MATNLAFEFGIDVDDSLEEKKVNNICIGWRNLDYSVKLSCQRGVKHILCSLNGSFRFGTLNGLMGPSGAGKTTFLNVLSGQVPFDNLGRGSEMYYAPNIKYCYIEQHVHQSIEGGLTVRQLFNYAYRFKNGIWHSSKIINEHIDDIVHQLMLPRDILDRKFVNCSGGEQKRIAIGQELMWNIKPRLMFVDEPTTGLDSASALEIIKCLRRLAIEYRMAIVTSIHQPNNEVLRHLDQLYVLAKGGVCIYSGPPNSITTNIETVNFSEDKPPIETLLKVACCNQDQGSTDVNELVNGLVHKTMIREFEKTLQIAQPTKQASRMCQAKLFHISDLYLECCRQFRLTFITNARSLFFQTLLFLCNFSLMSWIFMETSSEVSGCYSRTNSTACDKALSEDVHLRENVFNVSFTLQFVGAVVIYGCTTFITTKIRMFRNEYRNSWYSLSVFYWSTYLSNLIEILFVATKAALLGFYFMRQHAADDYEINISRFGLFYFYVTLFCLYWQNWGHLFGLLLPDQGELTSTFSFIFFMSTTALNGLALKFEINSSPMVIMVSKAFGLKEISNGILYSIYGHERCDFRNEYSLVFELFYVNYENPVNLPLIIGNIVLIRILTLIVAYIKYRNSGAKIPQFTKKPQRIVTLRKNKGKMLTENNTDRFVENDQNLQLRHFLQNKIIIAWRNLDLYESSSLFDVNYGKSTNYVKRRRILNNLNGQFRHGTLNALMGTSGAGKTSLLKVLNGQLNHQLSESTRIHLSKYMKTTTCYLSQEVDSHLVTGLTVRQTLVYASRLKNGGAKEIIDHDAIATELLKEIGLTSAADTRVERCSGGERKRIALALELTTIQMPSLVCIDEPTSGLDSNSAEIVIRCLRRITHLHHITIIASIHQPNIEQLLLFDDLYVLARGGHCVYSGPPTAISEQLKSEIEDFHVNNTKPCESESIERLILKSCAGTENPTVQKMIAIHNRKHTIDESTLAADTNLAMVVPNRKRFSLHSVYILALRYIRYYRNFLWFESMLYSVSLLMFALSLKLYFNFDMVEYTGCINIAEDDLSKTCGRSKEADLNLNKILDNSGYSFYFSVFFLFMSCLHMMTSFRRDLSHFINEHRNGWYSTGSFYLVTCIGELIPTTLVSFLFMYICDHYSPIRGSRFYWDLMTIIILALIASQAVSHLITTITRKYLFVQIIIYFSTFFFSVLIGNMYLSLYKLHYVLQFLSKFSIPRYTYQGIMLLQYGFGRCNPKEIQAVLTVMQVQDEDYYTGIVMLIFNIVFFHTVTILLLFRKVNYSNKLYRDPNQVKLVAENNKHLENSLVIIPGIDSFHQFRINCQNISSSSSLI